MKLNLEMDVESTVKYFQNYREMKSMASFKMKNKEKDFVSNEGVYTQKNIKEN